MNVETEIPKASEDTKESGHVGTLRLFLNYLTNVLMVIIVFICLLYSFQTGKFGAYELHIVLCVLGYQLLMSQGILVVSKYNYWSMYMSRRTRIHSHLVLQVLSIILITVGTVVICHHKYVNFDTTHGILGLCALIMSIMSAIDGIFLTYTSRLSRCISKFWIKYGHYALGVAGLVCSAASLCYGFEKRSFKIWANDDDNIVCLLIVLTSIFTVLVLSEFCFSLGRRLRNCK